MIFSYLKNKSVIVTVQVTLHGKNSTRNAMTFSLIKINERTFKTTFFK